MYCSTAKLVALDSPVDGMDKRRRAKVADRPAEQRDDLDEDADGAKVVACLEKARHLRLDEEKVHAVEIDVQRRRCRRQKREPLPPVLLGIEQKVGRHDRHADCHQHQNHKDEQHKAVKVVETVQKERVEHKEQLDKDRAKGEGTAEQAHRHRVQEPEKKGGRKDGKINKITRVRILKTQRHKKEKKKNPKNSRTRSQHMFSYNLFFFCSDKVFHQLDGRKQFAVYDRDNNAIIAKKKRNKRKRAKRSQGEREEKKKSKKTKQKKKIRPRTKASPGYRAG
jgi:hypothetical protein